MSSLAEKFTSGIARLLPSGKQADDPLNSVKSATRWLESLPVGDAYKSQQALFNVLKRFNEISTDFTKDHLAIFMFLDEKSRDLQDTLVRQYLRNPRMSRLVESQLWHAVYGLYWEIARGYHTFVLHMSHDAQKIQHDSHIPVITLRALRAFGQLLKWRAIRYLQPSEKLWLRLHNLYQVAESNGFHERLQRAYPGEETDCSCETAYLHILMLNLANAGTLYPKQLDLLDRWLCVWHEQLKLDTQLNTEAHNFTIDLSADHGPRRVRKIDSVNQTRFWSTDRLLVKLKEFQAALKQGNSPDQLNMAGGARTSESLELIDHLLHQWTSLEEREQRRAPRASIKQLVDVAHGLNAIIGQIKATDAPARISPYGTGLNYNEEDDVQVYGFITDRTRERASHMKPPVTNSPDIERWVMHDESECGFGAVVESRDKDWLRVGALIGIKSHESETWQIGIVRRLSRVNSDTSSVGIETLPETPKLGMLYDTGTASYTVNGVDNSGANLPHPSLWLAGDDNTLSVIIDPVHFLPGKVFQIHGVAEHKFIALSKPIEHSEGWLRVTAEPVSG